METHEFELSNGIPVVTALLPPYMPLSIQVTVLGGSSVELDKKEKDEHGCAHFSEHTVFRGGRDFPDVESVESEMWTLGRGVEALTAKEALIYYSLTDPRLARRVIHLFSDMFRFARIDPEEVEKERGVILQELGMLYEEMDQLTVSYFDEFLFGKNPFGREILGSRESIARLSAGDIRIYKERWFGPPNIHIAVAGYADPWEVKALLEEGFASIERKRPVPNFSLVDVVSSLPARFVSRKTCERAHIMIGGFGLPNRDPKMHAFMLLHAALNYRIWMQARVKRGLVYTIFALADMYSAIGAFKIYASTDSDKVKKVVEIILSNMADIKAGHLGEEEVQRVKNYLIGSMCFEKNGSEMIAHYLNQQKVRYGRIKSLEETHAEVHRVTKDELVRLAQSLWREENLRALLLARRFSNFEEEFYRLRSILR